MAAGAQVTRVSGAGHGGCATLSTDAGPADRSIAATHSRYVGPADPALVSEVVTLWRLYQDLVEAQRKLTLQAGAICRRLRGGNKKEGRALLKAIEKGTHLEEAVSVRVLLEARQPLDHHRKCIDQHLEELAEKLPAADFVRSVPQVSLLNGLAAIVGEAGDLSLYPNPAKLWKRFGVGLVNDPILGLTRQRLRTHKDPKLREELAALHGYNPKRRSVLWVACKNIILATGEKSKMDPGALGELYVSRKAVELAKNKKGHKARARRYVEKRYLRDLWMAWRGLPVRA